MRRLVYCIFGLISSMLFGQEKLSIHQIEEKIQLENKPIFLSITTDWCGICRIQSQQMAKDEDLIELMNSKIYFVEFNAESKEEVKLKNHVFTKHPNQYHNLVIELLGDSNEIIFPSWIVLSQEFEILDIYSGLLRPKDLKRMINHLTKE